MSKKDFGAAALEGSAHYENPFTNMGRSGTKKRAYTKRPPATPEEAAARAEEMRTQGREGCKLPRISVGFPPTLYEYVKVMAGMTGKDMTRFVVDIVAEHAEANKETYQQIKKLREKMAK